MSQFLSDKKLQQTILEHCGVTIERQLLRTFLERSYGTGGQLHSIAIHDKAMKAVRDSAYDEEVAKAKPVYAKLIKMFFDTPGTIGNLLSLLFKKLAFLCLILLPGDYYFAYNGIAR